MSNGRDRSPLWGAAVHYATLRAIDQQIAQEQAEAAVLLEALRLKIVSLHALQRTVEHLMEELKATPSPGATNGHN